MRLSKTLVDMDMADYSAALDPAYTTLEFENVQVLAMGNGRWGQVCSGVPVGAGVPRYGSGTLALNFGVGGGREKMVGWAYRFTQVVPWRAAKGLVGEGRPVG